MSEAAAAPAAVAVTIVCGAQDAWRARAIEALAATRPPGQRWAVLRTGVVLATSPPARIGGLVVHDAGAACGCCIGRVALRVALTRLLREAQRRHVPWHALVVDAGAAADPAALCEALLAPALGGRLAIVRRRLVIDPGVAADLLAAASTPQRDRLVAQLEFADEISLVRPAGSQAVIDRIRAAAPRTRRIDAIA